MSTKKNILILTEWSFKDPLIQSYTLPYVDIISRKLPAGSLIYLLTFEQEKYKLSPSEMEAAKGLLNEKGIILLDHPYHHFGIMSFIKWKLIFLELMYLIFKKNIRSIHAWCTTAGALGYILSKLSGRQLVIDSYEPHAEAMVENNTWSRSDLKFKFLFYFEKKVTQHASIIISATKGMYEYAIRKYNVEIKNFFVKPACVDFTKFSVAKRKNASLLSELGLENKIVCVYAGKFGGIYLSNEVFDFFSVAEKFWGDRFRVLLLTPQDNNELLAWAQSSGFSTDKMIIRFVDHDQIPDYMGLGDFGITPVKNIPTKRYCTPIKDGEYWALGLPVVITKDISDDSEIIAENNAGALINDYTIESYQAAIRQIDEILKEPIAVLSLRIEKLAKQFRDFKIADEIYGEIYK